MTTKWNKDHLTCPGCDKKVPPDAGNSDTYVKGLQINCPHCQIELVVRTTKADRYMWLQETNEL